MIASRPPVPTSEVRKVTLTFMNSTMRRQGGDCRSYLVRYAIQLGVFVWMFSVHLAGDIHVWTICWKVSGGKKASLKALKSVFDATLVLSLVVDEGGSMEVIAEFVILPLRLQGLFEMGCKYSSEALTVVWSFWRGWIDVFVGRRCIVVVRAHHSQID